MSIKQKVKIWKVALLVYSLKDPFEIRQGVTLAFFDGLNNVHLQLFNMNSDHAIGCWDD